MPTEITILILTPLSLEYDAILKNLRKTKSFVKSAAAYEVGYFKGKNHTYKIVVRETGMRNMEMALAAQKAIEECLPQMVFLSGIAGAIKDLEVGDVMVANKASLTSAGKEDKDGFKARPEVYYFSEELLARAQLLSRKTNWKKRTQDGAPNAKVVFGGILADDKVVASVKGPIYSRLRVHFNDSISIDMESAGLGRVLQSHRTIHSLVIRGISDKLSNKVQADASGSQSVAADRAAAFLFELLYEMDASNFIPSDQQQPVSLSPVQSGENTGTPNSYIKKIAQEVFKLIFTALTEEQKTGEGVVALQKLSTSLAKELKQLQREMDDEDTQAAFKVALRQILSADKTLEKELFQLLQQAKSRHTGDHKVSSGKNVIQNSKIVVGGNFHQGDMTDIRHKGTGDIVKGNKIVQNIYNTQEKKTDDMSEFTMSTLLRAKLQVLVEQARTEESITQLLEFVKRVNHPFKNEAIQLANNWNSTHFDEIKGVKSPQQISLEKYRISARFLSLLDKID